MEVEKVIYEEKIVEVQMKAPSNDVSCLAVDRIIRAEMELAGPEGEHLAKFNSLVAAHSSKHPGGTLPTELRSFGAYMGRLRDQLEGAEKARMVCLSCGKYPWTLTVALCRYPPAEV